MAEHPRWRDHAPPPEVTRVPDTRAASAAEQDKAAGGRDKRLVELPGGATATASMYLQHFPKTRRIYAYMRYKAEGRNVDRYVGDATSDDRAEALRLAWRRAHEKGLLDQTRTGSRPKSRQNR